MYTHFEEHCCNSTRAYGRQEEEGKKLFIGEEEGRCMTGRTQQWQDLNLWALQSTCSNAQLNGISEQLH